MLIYINTYNKEKANNSEKLNLVYLKVKIFILTTSKKIDI